LPVRGQAGDRALDREQPLRFLAELQRLEQRDHRVSRLVAELRAVLEEE
jgi:hypothetical protein